MTKPKIGIFGVSGCAGCMLEFLYEDCFKEIIKVVDIKAFPLIKENTYEGKFDLIFVEGTVCFDEDIIRLNELRKRSKLVVAIGSCACLGGVPSMKNFLDKEKTMKLVYPKINHLKSTDPTPLHDHVKIDYFIPQCPPDKKEIVEFIKAITSGKDPITYSDPVCVECRIKGNPCFLDIGEICLGPITSGGCNAICPSNNTSCYGCRGPCPDANILAFIEMLKEKGYNEKQIHSKMQTFAGLQFKEMEEQAKSSWLED